MKPNVYSKEFREFISFDVGKTKSIDDAIDFVKYVDMEKYNIEYIETNITVEQEIKQWRKFYLNRTKGSRKNFDDREFQPLVTKGEIQDFILSKLQIFDENGNIIFLDDLSIENATKKLIENILSKQIIQLKRVANKADALREVLNLNKLILDNLKDPINRRLLEGRFAALALDIKNAISIENVLSIIKDKMPKTITELFKKEGQDKLVDFVFGNLVDYDLRALPDFVEFSGLGNRFRARWREFLRNSVFNVNRPIKPSDVFDVVLDVYNNMKKDVIASRNIFKINFNNLLSNAINKRLSPFDFNTRLRELVRISGREAFRNGIQFVGLDPKDFHVLENFLISKMNNYVRFYITNLTSKVFSGLVSVAQSLIKSDAWASKFFDRFFEYARLAADRNGLYEWVYGDTNHCLSCLQANSQRHRLKDWYKSGILPQSNGSKELYCHGYYCKCKLVRVTGKARGRLDRIKTL